MQEKTQNFVRINNDEISKTLFGKAWTTNKAHKELLETARKALIRAAMLDQLPIIVDNCNLAPRHEEFFKQLIQEHNNKILQNKASGNIYSFEVRDLTKVSLQECLIRNSQRPNPVPEVDIIGMYDQFIKPKLIEAATPDVNKPKAIISDIDGTVALLGDRNIYEHAKAGKDPVNKAVACLVLQQKANGTVLIFVTGRSEEFRDITEAWMLEKLGLQKSDYLLYMRPSNDKRPDSEIKKEIYLNQIQNNYNVTLWFEDRQRVVTMVRHELGLTCVQVDDGLF